MSNDPAKMQQVAAERPIPPFEFDNLRFTLASGLRSIPGENPGWLFNVHAPDGSFVGTVTAIRAEDRESVAEIGHIGVEVEPQWRGRGMPARFARAVVPLLRDEGVDEIMFTCDQANEAMKQTIRSLGAEYLDEWSGEGGTPKTRFVLR